MIKLKKKLTGWVAVLGLSLVLTGIVSRYLGFLTVDQRTGLFIIGFAMMLLGTIWKAVLEMNEREH